MALAKLTEKRAEKRADIDMRRPMVQFMAQRLMELDVDGRCGAGRDEKTPERLNSRNGYCHRTWDTCAGSVELRIPWRRQGSCLPEFLAPRGTAEKPLTAVIRGACLQCIGLGLAPPPRATTMYLREHHFPKVYAGVVH